MAKAEWVKPEHTVWASVATAGWVDVEWKNRHEAPDRLPPGLRMTLKHVDREDQAWVYRDDMGVMRVPAWCLDPWDR